MKLKTVISHGNKRYVEIGLSRKQKKRRDGVWMGVGNLGRNKSHFLMTLILNNKIAVNFGSGI